MAAVAGSRRRDENLRRHGARARSGARGGVKERQLVGAARRRPWHAVVA